eukprot:TRINITY_DN75007_c0_g1_i1.p2 TRINITY_DN75007_c0_g1~~TRINITY_DN75007_c0_g1_i1.p2  ORF type:complete len:128 (-),score=12.89 TRINITY_DN75007_c0_g1_i1:124-507(-)
MAVCRHPVEPSDRHSYSFVLRKFQSATTASASLCRRPEEACSRSEAPTADHRRGAHAAPEAPFNRHTGLHPKEHSVPARSSNRFSHWPSQKLHQLPRAGPVAAMRRLNMSCVQDELKVPRETLNSSL